MAAKKKAETNVNLTGECWIRLLDRVEAIVTSAVKHMAPTITANVWGQLYSKYMPGIERLEKRARDAERRDKELDKLRTTPSYVASSPHPLEHHLNNAWQRINSLEVEITRLREDLRDHVHDRSGPTGDTVKVPVRPYRGI